jgi:hypothetical protein
MEINNPNARREVEAAFNAYETALTGNDVPALDASFWPSPHTIRYGVAENLYGYDEIKAFRAARSPLNLARRLERTVITSFGNDVATACTLYRRDAAPDRIGRQSQVWVRLPEGWRVVAAHVSLIGG